MSTTFKAVVYAHHKKADGTYNVKIRVTHNRQRRHIATNIFVTKEELTRGLKIKSAKVNDLLKKEIIQYQEITATIPTAKASCMGVVEVVEYISNYERTHSVFNLDFIEFGRQIIDEYIKGGRIGTAKSYECTINALVRWLKREHLYINEITVQFLTDFYLWIKNDMPARQGRKKGERAPSLYLGNIRILHNKAKDIYNDEDAGVIRIPLSPFKRFHVPRQPLTRKRSITTEQLQAIMQVPDGKTKDSRITLARDMFLLSFGEGDRIIYQRTKTRNRRVDHETISIKIEPCVMPLLEKYRDKTSKRVFSFYQRYSDSHTFNANINKGLKIIGAMQGVGIADLEFYAARHTWATLARNKAGIDKSTIHEALNHVDEQMRITDIYIDRDYSNQDEANKTLLELVRFTPPLS